MLFEERHSIDFIKLICFGIKKLADNNSKFYLSDSQSRAQISKVTVQRRYPLALPYPVFYPAYFYD